MLNEVSTRMIMTLVGLSSTALVTAFTIGIWVATVSTKQEAMGSEVAKLKSTQPELSERVVRIETILTYAFPKEAKRATR